MANEYKAWYRRNNPQNAREGMDAYNRPYSERYERPPAYSSRGEEYNRFPERHDIAADQEKKMQAAESKDQSQEKSRAKRRAQSSRAGQTAVKSVVQTVVGNAVAIVVGAVVVVSGYQAIEAEKALMQETPAVVAETSWDWTDWTEESEQTVMVTLSDEEGAVIAEMPAVVAVTIESEATCDDNGLKKYTATVEYEGKTYTDVQEVVIPKLGHLYGDGIPITTEMGPGILYECERCHEEHFVEGDFGENE